MRLSRVICIFHIARDLAIGAWQICSTYAERKREYSRFPVVLWDILYAVAGGSFLQWLTVMLTIRLECSLQFRK